MIKLTKMSKSEFYLNPHLIERIEEKPDTLITMDSQTQYLVLESADEILEQIIEYRKRLIVHCQE